MGDIPKLCTGVYTAIYNNSIFGKLPHIRWTGKLSFGGIGN